MDGVHDLGGKQGFGPVHYTQDASPFHERWEVRVNSLYANAVRRGVFNMDEYRHAIERMDARHYVTASYYERSLTSLATLCVEKGLVTREELERRAEGAFPLALPSAPGRGNVPTRQRFALGDVVRVRDESVRGHMRMPGYVRGKSGVVVGISPAYPFPDAHAHGVHSSDEPTYDVRFRSEDLWPGSSDPALVHVGLFESYLDPASQPA
jgi:nitrile hydratase beta subunit